MGAVGIEEHLPKGANNTQHGDGPELYKTESNVPMRSTSLFGLLRIPSSFAASLDLLSK